MICALFLILLVISAECAENKEVLKEADRVVVMLDPDQVVNAFKSVVSSDYLRTLAHDLASKAAEHFLIEVKNKNPTSGNSPNRASISEKPRYVARLKTVKLAPLEKVGPSIKEEVLEEIERLPPKIIPPELNTSFMDVKQALTLIKDPSPDGDNLDLISPNLSEDEETKEKKKETPVVQVMKVNGKYYRRLLGFL